jgi:hypothetical protein
MGMVINGKYYKDEIHIDISKNSATYKQWHMSEQRKLHAKDIIQPFKNGKPNEDFKIAFPEESKERGFLPNDNDLRNL